MIRFELSSDLNTSLSSPTTISSFGLINLTSLPPCLSGIPAASLQYTVENPDSTTPSLFGYNCFSAVDPAVPADVFFTQVRHSHRQHIDGKGV